MSFLVEALGGSVCIISWEHPPLGCQCENRITIWMFPNIGVSQPPKMDGLFFMENPIKMDDLGGFPIFFGLTPICS